MNIITTTDKIYNNMMRSEKNWEYIAYVAPEKK
jgi:hypothetical protein